MFYLSKFTALRSVFIKIRVVNTASKAQAVLHIGGAAAYVKNSLSQLPFVIPNAVRNLKKVYLWFL